MSIPRIICPFCDKSFGQEKRFLSHLTEIHEVNDHQTYYVENKLKNIWPTCGCGCGVRLKWNGWKKGFTSQFLRGHNAVHDSNFHDKSIHKKMAEKRKKGFASGKYAVWNDGLTKKTSKIIQSSADKISRTLNERYASGDLKDWRQNDPVKAQIVAKKMSETKKKKFETGELVPWNKGLTKQTDVRMKKMSDSLRITLTTNSQSSAKRWTPEQIISIVKEAGQDCFTLLTNPEDYRNKYQQLSFRCNECNEHQNKTLMMLIATPKCFNCHPKESLGQLEVLDFVRSLGVNAISNDRTVIAPKELDIWIPSYRLGIEYNGLYYHSTARLTDPAHAVKKLNACKKADISLFTIFEDEWRDKREIVEGMIRHRLHVQPRHFMARKLIVRELTKEETKKFFNENHLEGHVISKTAYGLLNGDEVLAAMSLRNPFHHKYANWYELARSCCHRETVISGWLSKLTYVIKCQAFSDGKLGIMTYVDSRVGSGSGYAAAGWTMNSVSTGARFWWTDYVNRYNRFKYKADKSREMSQAQIAEEAGVTMIHGCPNSRWSVTSSH